MTDDLIYSIFKELAVLEDKRTVDGQWKTDDPAEISRLLSRAFATVSRASARREPAPDE